MNMSLFMIMGFEVEKTDKLLNISFPTNILSYLSINWVV